LDRGEDVRAHAETWFRRAIAFTADAGGRATGGHVGAFSVTDAAATGRRTELEEGLRGALGRLAGAAWLAGLEAFLIENGAAAREPFAIDALGHLLSPGGARRVPVALCLDVVRARDPSAWLLRMGSRAPAVQVPGTKVPADRVLAALDRSGASDVALILEVD